MPFARLLHLSGRPSFETRRFRDAPRDGGGRCGKQARKKLSSVAGRGSAFSPIPQRQEQAELLHQAPTTLVDTAALHFFRTYPLFAGYLRTTPVHAHRDTLIERPLGKRSRRPKKWGHKPCSNHGGGSLHAVLPACSITRRLSYYDLPKPVWTSLRGIARWSTASVAEATLESPGRRGTNGPGIRNRQTLQPRTTMEVLPARLICPDTFLGMEACIFRDDCCFEGVQKGRSADNDIPRGCACRDQRTSAAGQQ